MAVLLIVIVFLWVAANPPSSSSSSSGESHPGGGSGAGITVQLGAPVLTNITCGAGGTDVAERVAWQGASATLTTSEINLFVVETADGDLLSGPSNTPSVTAQDPCAGSPPSPDYTWYAALENPSGTVVASYTLTEEWKAVGGGGGTMVIEPGSTVVILTTPSLHDNGYSLQVQGLAAGETVTGFVPL